MSGAFSFAARSVAVLGGASDMGLAVARRFGEAGADVVLGDIDGARLGLHADTLHAEGLEVTTAMVDVRDRGAVDGFIDRAGAPHDRLDVLVNLAAPRPGSKTRSRRRAAATRWASPAPATTSRTLVSISRAMRHAM